MKRELPQEWISAYVDGELTAAEQAEVEAALRESAELRQQADDYRLLSENLQRIPRATLDEGFASRVLRAAERASERTSERANLRGESSDGRRERSREDGGVGVRIESREETPAAALNEPLAGNPLAGNPLAGNPLAGNPLAGNPFANDTGSAEFLREHARALRRWRIAFSISSTLAALLLIVLGANGFQTLGSRSVGARSDGRFTVGRTVTDGRARGTAVYSWDEEAPQPAAGPLDGSVELLQQQPGDVPVPPAGLSFPLDHEAARGVPFSGGMPGGPTGEAEGAAGVPFGAEFGMGGMPGLPARAAGKGTDVPGFGGPGGPGGPGGVGGGLGGISSDGESDLAESSAADGARRGAVAPRSARVEQPAPEMRGRLAPASQPTATADEGPPRSRRDVTLEKRFGAPPSGANAATNSSDARGAARAAEKEMAPKPAVASPPASPPDSPPAVAAIPEALADKRSSVAQPELKLGDEAEQNQRRLAREASLDHLRQLRETRAGQSLVMLNLDVPEGVDAFRILEEAMMADDAPVPGRDVDNADSRMASSENQLTQQLRRYRLGTSRGNEELLGLDRLREQTESAEELVQLAQPGDVAQFVLVASPRQVEGLVRRIASNDLVQIRQRVMGHEPRSEDVLLPLMNFSQGQAVARSDDAKRQVADAAGTPAADAANQTAGQQTAGQQTAGQLFLWKADVAPEVVELGAESRSQDDFYRWTRHANSAQNRGFVGNALTRTELARRNLNSRLPTLTAEATDPSDAKPESLADSTAVRKGLPKAKLVTDGTPSENAPAQPAKAETAKAEKAETAKAETVTEEPAKEQPAKEVTASDDRSVEVSLDDARIPVVLTIEIVPR